jgi:hypothetical protein
MGAKLMQLIYKTNLIGIVAINNNINLIIQHFRKETLFLSKIKEIVWMLFFKLGLGMFRAL